jgi:hypothetical protein
MLKFIQTADGQYLNMTRMTGFKVEQGDYGTFDIVAFLQLDEEDSIGWVVDSYATDLQASTALCDLMLPFVVVT